VSKDKDTQADAGHTETLERTSGDTAGRTRANSLAGRTRANSLAGRTRADSLAGRTQASGLESYGDQTVEQTQSTLLANQIDLSNLASFKSEDPAQVQRLNGEYLSAVFVYIKTGIIFEVNNPTMHHACDRLCQIANFMYTQLEGSAAIHFMTDGVYVNRSLLKVQGSRFEQCEYLTELFHALGVGSIHLLGETDRDDWLEFMSQFHRFMRGESAVKDLSTLKLQNIQLSAPENKDGEDNEVAVTDRFRTLRGYSVAVISCRVAIEKLKGSGELRLATMKRSLLELATVSEQCPDILIGMINLKRHKVGVPHHLMNTAVLVMLVAKELGINRKDRLELVMQAALHGVGRSLLPEEAKDHDPVIEERRRAQESIGQVARTLAMFNRTAMRVAVANEVRMWVDKKSDHNDAYDFDLTAPTRIIAVCRAYDLLTTPTKHRPALLPDEALQVIHREAGRRYDEAAARVLVNVLGVFPVGSVVGLNNGKTAIVVEAPTSGDPTRPRVKLIRDAVGKTIDGAIVDLSKSRDVKITGCVDAEEKQVNIPAFLLA